MQITLNKNIFVKKFLSPINKISDSGVFTIQEDGVECLSTSSFDKKEQTIILYAKYNDTIAVEEDVNLNIPDINKLINAFSFLNESDVTFTVNSNNLAYSSSNGTSFKYHLLEDGILEKPTVKMDNVYNMGFDLETSVEKETFRSILKGSTFADKTNKIYLYTKEDAIYALLTDENIQNVDLIEFKLAESYMGDDIVNKIPINLEIFRVISTLNFDTVTIKINIKKGIIMFEIEDAKFTLQYIITSLVK